MKLSILVLFVFLFVGMVGTNAGARGGGLNAMWISDDDRQRAKTGMKSLGYR